MRGRPRRRPWPYDISLSIDGGTTYTGLLLGKPDKGAGTPLVSSKPPNQAAVTPTDYGYSADNPVFGKWESWGNLGRGMGFKVQEKPEDMGYDHAINADLSLGYLWLKGPNISTITPTPLQQTITNSGVAVDKGGGKVGLPCTAHGFGSGEPIAVTGTTNYNGNYSVDATSTTNEIVITATYTAETFGASARANYRPEITALFDVAGVTYELGGRVCLVRGGDNASDWTVSQDFGSGKVALDAIVFYSNVSGGAETAYVAMGDSEPIWRLTGGTWTQCVEKQTVAIGGVPTGGTFTLTYNGNTSGTIAHNASAATVQTALRAVTGLSSVTVTASGTLDPGPVTYTVTFYGVTGVTSGGDTSPPQMTSDATSLTGGTPTITHATTQDLEIIYARAFCKVSKELYRAHSTNTLAKCDTDADPFDWDNWGAENAFTVGDKNSGIVRLAATVGGAMVIYKTDGIYTLGEDGTDYNLFPHLGFTPSTNNGKAHGPWLNDEYVVYNNGTYRIRSDFSIEQIGPEKLTANDSDVRGYISALQGHETFNLYAAIYNQDIDSGAGASYIMKFGTWMSGGGGEATRLDAWHGSISAKFAAKKITAMFKSTVGAATGHSRLYLGFSDGTVGWFLLPCMPNPAACTQYTFSTTDGEVYLPIWHGMFKNNEKALRAFAVTGENLTPSNYAQVSYELDSDSSYTAMADDTPTTFNFDNASGRERNEFSDNTSATTVKLKIIMVSSATSSCPRLTGCGLNYQLRDEQLRQLYQFMVLAEDRLIKRDGSMMRIGANTIRDVLEDAEALASFKIVLPDEETKDMAIVDFGQAMAFDERTRQWRAAIALDCVEFSTDISKGLLSTLEGYTLTLLEGLTLAGMEAA